MYWRTRTAPSIASKATRMETARRISRAASAPFACGVFESGFMGSWLPNSIFTEFHSRLLWYHISPNGQYSRYFRLLSRFGRGAGRRRRDRGRRPGRAVHAPEARSRVPGQGGGILPPGRGPPAGRPGLRRLLRQAAPQVRPPARDPPRVRAERVPILPEIHAGLAEAQALRAPGAGSRPQAQVSQAIHLHRAPRVACGECLLPFPVRGGGHPHPGRRRRVGHREPRHGTRKPDPADARAPVPTFAGAALFRLHLLLRIPGQFRRIQADGARALRRAYVRRVHPREDDRSEAGRLLPDGYVVLQLLPG